MAPAKFGYTSGGASSTDVLFRMSGDAKQLLKEIGLVAGAFKGLDAQTAMVASRMTKGFDMMSIAIAGMGAVTLGLMMNAAKSAARIEELDTVLKLVAGRLGYTEHEINGMVQELIDYGISMEVARQSLLAFTHAHMKLEEAVRLARVAQDLAVISGQDSSETFKHLTLAVAKANTRMLMTFGILTTNIAAWKTHAKELGKSVNELTIVEKRQAVLNAIFKEAATMSGAYEEAMTTSAKQLRTFNRYIQDLRVELGQALLPVFNTVIYTGTEMFKTWRNLSDGTKGLIGNIIVLSGTFLLVTGSVMKLLSAVDKLADSYVAYTNTMLAGNIEAQIARQNMISWGLAAGAVGIAVTGLVWAWQQHQKVIREANKELEDAVVRYKHIQEELARLEEQYETGVIDVDTYTEKQQVLQDQLEKSIYTFDDYIEKLGILARIRLLEIEGLTASIPLYSVQRSEIEGAILTFERITGKIVKFTKEQEYLRVALGDTNYEQIKAIQGIKLYGKAMFDSAKEIKRVAEVERLRQEQIEEHMKTMEPLRMMYKDYLDIQLDVVKKEEDLAEITQDLIDLRKKEDELINGKVITIMSAEAARDKYTKKLEQEKRTHATLIGYQNKEAKTAVQRQQINDRLAATESKYNRIVAERIELEGKLSGVTKVRYGTEEEIAEVQAKIATKILEEKHGREELIELQEKQRTAVWMLNNELLENIKATDRFSEGIVTLPEVIEFWIENNIWESKEELETFQELAKELEYIEGKFFVNTEGALLDIGELNKRYGLLVALFGKEMAIKLTTVWAQEEITILKEKLKGLTTTYKSTKLTLENEDIETGLRKIIVKDLEETSKNIGKVEKDIQKLESYPFSLNTEEAEQKISDLETSIKELPDSHSIDVSINRSKFDSGYEYIVRKLNRISTISLTPTLNIQTGNLSSIERRLSKFMKYGGIFGLQHGGVFSKPTLGIFGEAGAEAVIPLTRKSIHPVIREMQETLGIIRNKSFTQMTSFQYGGVVSSTLSQIRKLMSSNQTEKIQNVQQIISSPIIIENMSVRSKQDIYDISKEIETLRKNELRSLGIKE